MTRFGFALSMLAVVAIAAWAYHVNYRTKTALNNVDALRSQIAAEREAVEVLRIEWAYLNAPDRLSRLVALQYDRLGLGPMRPQNFDDVAAIPYPRRPPASLQEDPGLRFGLEPEIVVSRTTEREASQVPLPMPRPARWRR